MRRAEILWTSIVLAMQKIQSEHDTPDWVVNDFASIVAILWSMIDVMEIEVERIDDDN